MSKFQNIKKVKNSASMQEVEKKQETKKTDKKRKMITISLDWEEKIKSAYPGTVSSYIMMAVGEKMKREGLI